MGADDDSPLFARVETKYFMSTEADFIVRNKGSRSSSFCDKASTYLEPCSHQAKSDQSMLTCYRYNREENKLVFHSEYPTDKPLAIP